MDSTWITRGIITRGLAWITQRLHWAGVESTPLGSGGRRSSASAQPSSAQRSPTQLISPKTRKAADCLGMLILLTKHSAGDHFFFLSVSLAFLGAQNQFIPAQPSSAQRSPAQPSSAELSPAQLSSAQLRAAQPNSAQLSPDQPSSPVFSKNWKGAGPPGNAHFTHETLCWLPFFPPERILASLTLSEPCSESL